MFRDEIQRFPRRGRRRRNKKGSKTYRSACRTAPVASIRGSDVEIAPSTSKSLKWLCTAPAYPVYPLFPVCPARTIHIGRPRTPDAYPAASTAASTTAATSRGTSARLGTEMMSPAKGYHSCVLLLKRLASERNVESRVVMFAPSFWWLSVVLRSRCARSADFYTLSNPQRHVRSL